MRILFLLQGLHSVSVVVLAVRKCPLPAGPDVVGSRGGWSSSDCESDWDQYFDRFVVVMIRAASGSVRCWDAWNAFVESMTGFVRPVPPSLTGRPNWSRSSFEYGGLPVSAGMKV